MPRFDEHSKTRTVTLVAVAALCLLGMACAGGPEGPPEGSPEWYWAAALDNYAVPEYVKTVEHLKEAMEAESELGQNAALWRASVTAGLARGYAELASAFSEGIESNEVRTEDFQPLINDYRRRTRINAIEFSENVGRIKEVLDGKEAVPLSFPLPEGNGTASTVLSTIRAGNKADAEHLAMEDQTLTWGIFSVLSDFTGGTEASELIQDAAADGIQANSDDMEFGIARILLDISIMFDREGLNEPRVRKFIFDLAEKWAEPHLESEKFADQAEEFEFDVENEKRDMEGKRRMKKDS